MKRGSIIQLHTGTEHTAEALPQILEYLKNENLSSVPVSELIYLDDFIIDNNGMQISEKETSL
ncbi:MAG: hypothetical protein IKM66_11035 [Clostridia bacterium]|nr:hypothetical protein [Clostridia bacterium]